MWNIINNDSDIKRFMDTVGFFHDSCIKEMRYISGAYVNEDLSMHPINDRRNLSIIIQRQSKENSVIELNFEGLKYLNLFPADDMYTCEILNSSVFFKDGYVFWRDSDDISDQDFKTFNGTFVCALKLRWRIIEDKLGNRE